MSGPAMWTYVAVAIVFFWWGSRWGTARERVNAHLRELRRRDVALTRDRARQFIHDERKR